MTTILDLDKDPTRDLAAVYAQRWEVETSIKETKTYQGRPNMVLVIRWLIHQASLGGEL